MGTSMSGWPCGGTVCISDSECPVLNHSNIVSESLKHYVEQRKPDVMGKKMHAACFRVYNIKLKRQMKLNYKT